MGAAATTAGAAEERGRNCGSGKVGQVPANLLALAADSMHAPLQCQGLGLSGQQTVPAAASCCPCRQRHLLATFQLQNMAKLLEDAAAGRYKRAVDPAASAAAAAAAVSASESGAGGEAAAAAPAGSSKQLVLSELSKASQKQAKLVEVLHSLQAQVPGMQDDLHRVLLHAAATTAWLPQAVATI